MRYLSLFFCFGIGFFHQAYGSFDCGRILVRPFGPSRLVQSPTWRATASRPVGTHPAANFETIRVDFEVNDQTITLSAFSVKGEPEHIEAQRVPDREQPTYFYLTRRMRPSSHTGALTSVQVIGHVEVSPAILDGGQGTITLIDSRLRGGRITLEVSGS